MLILDELKDRLFKYEKAYMARKSENVHLEDIQKLSFDYNELITSEIAKQNDSYGHAKVIKKYAGLDPNCIFNFVIEHAPYIYKDFVNSLDILYRTPIVCMSDFRKKILENRAGKQAYVIGPYIAYAEDYYSKDMFQSEKAKYGKTLLVLPKHSGSERPQSYNIQEFINEIESIKYNFDTVMVCIYARDFRNGNLWKVYRDMGYIIVSAGYVFSENFLSRQKTILKLADAVIMNGFTTGLGYAVYLNKPCYMYNQQIQDEPKGSIIKYADQIFCEEFYKLREVFNNKTFQRTEEQRKLCNYIFGLDKVLSKEQMREMLIPLLLKR